MASTNSIGLELLSDDYARLQPLSGLALSIHQAILLYSEILPFDIEA
ncbi:hypothetical protein [Leptothoe kymatousa]|uniref:Uncharacterized protein n=1 Tax=Leptothoe kymatousa TAU-MAC 1615 TaxID=2364775 RepID=A0ABS5Y7A9_9CYAN|nr:hypothetical protein [Leptothoe kymatousa]MBT9313713.1 hypothetical protein [Leptothoe kymatousa TAU-MAC 1615]